MKSKVVRGLFLILMASHIGCAGEAAKPEVKPSSNPTQVKYTDLLLKEEPANAKGVIEIRKETGDGTPVVITGRIAGSAKPFVKGMAAFTIVDVSLESCEDEKPWVYCCTPKEKLREAMVAVKFVDANGKPINQDAQDLFKIKEWQTVVVKGKTQRDADGGLTAIVADGLYVKGNE